MKITPFNGPKAINAYASQGKNDKLTRKENLSTANDNLEISSQAQELVQYKKELNNAPAIREEKVAALKAQINNGSYSPSAQKIVAGMVEERRLDKLI